MGHKKRNPAPRSRPSTATVAPTDTADGQGSIEDERSPPILGSSDESRHEPTKIGTIVESNASSDSAVKLECERALNALRRGNHTRALRLLKESCLRHEGSALLHRVQGTVCVKVASLIEDPNAKQRHLKNAIESAQRAVSLSPNSIEFAYFYANLLYEAADDNKGYEEVVQECKRALLIQNPVDPAKECLQDESQQKVLTTDARIAHVQKELQSLIHKSSIASIWVKNLGNGEEKFRLIPMRRLPEDPMEVRLVQTRRPNEIKRATKTPEERRKEIEVRVAAARLLQQKSDSPQSQNDEDRMLGSSSGANRVGERRRYANLRKIASSADRMDQIQSYWNSMSLNKKQSLLKVSVCDLRAHFSSSKDGLAVEVLSEALSFAVANKTWKFWVCCRCNEKFIDCESHKQHIVQEHMGNLSQKLQWVEMLLNGSWKPVDVSAAVHMLEDQSKGKSTNLVDIGNREDCLTDNWCSKDMWDSYPNEGKLQLLDEEPKAGEICNGSPVGTKTQDGISNFELREFEGNKSKEYSLAQSWPLSDDYERAKLLDRIRDMFQLLLRHKYLVASHLDWVIQYTMEELPGLPMGSRLLNHGLERTPLCICFLGASQLRKILKFLQELSHFCDLKSYSEKSVTADDSHSCTQGFEIKEGIDLSGDSSYLLLDERLLQGELTPSTYHNACADEGVAATSFLVGDREDGVLPNSNAMLSWIFTGPSSGEQLASWTRLRKEKTHQGIEVLQTLAKDFDLLQELCVRKCKHLSYNEALQEVERLCLEEIKKRDYVTKFVSRSYEAILRKRQEDLAVKSNEETFIRSTFELDAITNVLKEAQSLNVTPLGYEETLTGVASRLCDLDSGEDIDWKMQGYLHQADTCIEMAIQRQKEQLSEELSKIDARIMRSDTGMQQLELKLGLFSAYDYWAIMLHLVKSFMRSHLEDLVDKDATERSEAAREAFLAELALDAKKNINRGGDHSKQIHEKSRDKKKNKDYRKAKDLKATGGSEQLLLPLETTERICSPVASDESHPDSEIVVSGSCDDLRQQEEDFRREIELEAEERKLEETLEFQRRIENETKQKHLAEQLKKASGTVLEDVEEGLSVVDLKANAECQPISLLGDDGSPVSWKGGDLGVSHSQVFFPMENQDIEWHHSRKYSRGHNTLLSSEVDVSSRSQEKLLEPYTYHDLSGGKTIMPKDLAGVPINNAEQTAVPSKSSANYGTPRTKRTNSQSHGQVKQGLPNQGIPRDGGLPSDQRSGGQGKRRNSSTKSLDRSPRALSSEKENHEVGSLQIEGFTKKQVRGQENLHGGNIDPCSGDSGTKTLSQLHAEEDDEERFQADLRKAVRQSLDTFQVHQSFPLVPQPKVSQKKSLEAEDFEALPNEVMFNNMSGTDVFGAGLKNEVGEYNCFLNVIIQSLWHLRRFRDEFLRRSTSVHVHVGDPCVICALYDIFTALSLASTDMRKEAIAPTCLRIALSNLCPDSNFFQEAQMNDASEVLAVIFDSLHRSFTSGSGVYDTNCIGSWDCISNACLAHSLFGMNISEEMKCTNCPVVSRHLKYTSFFHNINANALRRMKIKHVDRSFDDLLNLVEMKHRLPCDPEAGGCGALNCFNHNLSSPPHVFTTVLGWQNTSESVDAISATLAALTPELDIGVLYDGLGGGNRYCLVSVVCYYGQHYHCFAYSREHERWIMYDDKTVKVIGGWDDVLTMCERGHLQPQIDTLVPPLWDTYFSNLALPPTHHMST